jgi:hypothetical protein
MMYASGNGPRKGMNKKHIHSKVIQEIGKSKQLGHRETFVVMKFHAYAETL